METILAWFGRMPKRLSSAPALSGIAIFAFFILPPVLLWLIDLAWSYWTAEPFACLFSLAVLIALFFQFDEDRVPNKAIKRINEAANLLFRITQAMKDVEGKNRLEVTKGKWKLQVTETDA